MEPLIHRVHGLSVRLRVQDSKSEPAEAVEGHPERDNHRGAADAPPSIARTTRSGTHTVRLRTPYAEPLMHRVYGLSVRLRVRDSTSEPAEAVERHPERDDHRGAADAPCSFARPTWSR